MIDEFTTNMDVELQQRSCEYHNVLLRLSSPQRFGFQVYLPVSCHSVTLYAYISVVAGSLR